MKRSDSITKLIPALIKAQSEMSNVVKDSKNPFFKSNYADINALREEAMPILLKNGIAIIQPPTTFEGKNYIETSIVHESGEYISSLNEVVVSKQNDPQSYLAAQTYTRRGALQAFLSMGAVDDDGNYASGRSDKLVNNTPPPKQTNTVNDSKPAHGTSTIVVTPAHVAASKSAVEEFQAAKPRTTSFKAAAEAKKAPAKQESNDDLDL